jgi:hypothetical protein
MSSSSVDNDSGAEEDTVNGDAPVINESSAINGDDDNMTQPAAGRIVEILQEERDTATTPLQLGNGVSRYKAVQQIENESEESPAEALPLRPGSPVESMSSIPDDTPSVQVASPTSNTSIANIS